MPSDSHRVVWSPESEGDLLSIWRQGASQFSPAVADGHLRDIHRAAARLAASPLMGRERNDLRPGVREIVVYPTVLFYRVSGERVEVVRVVDGRRDLGALFTED
jgi:toxin ParE1/3/4